MKILRKILAIAYLTVVATDLAGASTVITVISSKKNPAEENRMVSGFDGISSSGSYNVYITMGNTESLRLEGDQEQISQIDTKVENGILKIRNKKQMSHRTWSNRGKVNVYITAKTLNSLVLSGSGDIEVKGRVNSEKFSNTISGSGSISSNLDVKDYTATISGSGKIRAKGNVNNAKITIAGSGDFEGGELQAANASAKVSGSGNISIHANKNLEALMSGSGNIRYSGNANVKSTKSGSGKISKGL